VVFFGRFFARRLRTLVTNPWIGRVIMLLGGRGLLEEGDIQQSSYGGDWCIDWSVDHIQQMPVQTRS